MYKLITSLLILSLFVLVQTGALSTSTRGDTVLPSSYNATFQTCQNPSPSTQLWNFTGSPNTAGMLKPIINNLLCLVPLNCSADNNVPLVMNFCNITTYCNKYVYDTFTYFTFTNTNNSLLITDNGPDQMPIQQSSSGNSNQQFMYNPSTQTIVPADNSNLCLTFATP